MSSNICAFSFDTDNGDVFTVGSGKKGQLGIVIDGDVSPKQIQQFQKGNTLCNR